MAYDSLPSKPQRLGTLCILNTYFPSRWKLANFSNVRIQKEDRRVPIDVDCNRDIPGPGRLGLIIHVSNAQNSMGPILTELRGFPT
ncbi:hypothetical protein K439DRAFT_491408 [Ramaria rubella]|nr:hypothetical protein K439DRAFT_696217 [Ramaria rubella]KAF8578267.1 hypothetical protein K439DRAFT_491408 [Ramaria rubella]